MKPIYVSVALLWSVCLTTFANPYDWKHSSVLSSGKWVEVSVENEGIKKITFDQLRDMGFNDPSRVSVYGCGSGAQLPLAYFDNNGRWLQPDDLSPIGCSVIEDALYFYAQGTDNYKFEATPEIEAGGVFRHIGKNIYSERQVFMLTDEAYRKPVEEDNPATLTDIPLEQFGHGIIFHEKDLWQNDKNNGQLFWGEKFPADGARLEWDFAIPGAGGNPAVMEYALHLESDNTAGPQGLYSFGVSFESSEAGRLECTTTNAPLRNKTAYHAPQKTTPYEFTMPSDSGRVFASYDSGGSECYVANLDWWSISVKFDIRRRLDAHEGNLTFAVVSAGRKIATIPINPEMVAWDVTDPDHPVKLRPSGNGKDVCLDFHDSEFRIVSIFAPDAALGSICHWKRADNQNLHAFATEGADLAIICLPWLREKALEIADLHEKEMGQKCVVATTEEVYREFSNALPDPMAYRNFVRMLYDSPSPVKNLLLLGSITADARGVRASSDRGERIIEYQKSLSSKIDGAMSDVDVYGVMNSGIGNGENLETLQMEVGVGVLPVASEEEASLYIEKLKNYLSGDGLELCIADHLIIGCDGDNHQHEKQCELIRTHLDSFCKDYHHIPVYDDQIGVGASRTEIIRAFNSGIGLVSYIGHGGCFNLTKESGIFDYSDIGKLRNSITPLMFFAACNITNGDMGQRGLGEQMVVGTRLGLIGAVLSNRTAMSTANYELLKTFYSELHNVKSDIDNAITPVTIGEAYAKTKSSTKSTNELAFQLMCDPAVIIPVPVYSMTDPHLEAVIGRKVSVVGYVVDSNGNVADNFNGSASVRIAVPASYSVISGVVSGDEGPSVKSEDKIIIIGKGEVTNGRYELSIAPGMITIPYVGSQLKAVLSAYDSAQKIGASSSFNCNLMQSDCDNTNEDTIPPSVEYVEYADQSGALIITSTDDTALDLSTEGLQQGFSVAVDGKSLSPSILGNIKFMPDASRCVHSIYLPTLEAGIHTLSVRLTDISGNRSSYDTTFMVGEEGNQISLVADCRHTEGVIIFTLDKKIDIPDPMIHIIDAQGKSIMTLAAKGTSVRLSTDSIPSGLVRAFCEDPLIGVRSHTVTLPIIKPESSR